MNLATNYSGAGALLTTDDLVFNNTSVINAIATNNLDVGSVTIASTFSGQWSVSGRTLTVENNTGFSDSGITSTHNYGNGITLNGASAVFTVTNGVATINSNSCILTFNGTAGCTYTDGKGLTISGLVLGNSAILTNSSTAVTTVNGSGIPLTLGTSATYTNNYVTYFFCQTSTALHSIGAGSTVNGNASIIFGPNASSISMTFPAFTFTGTGAVFFQPNGARTGWSITLTGAFSATSTTVFHLNLGASASGTIDFSTFGITANELRAGSNGAGGTLTVNFGSGSHSISTFNGTTYNTGTTNNNFQTCSITCSGNWTFGSNHTVTATSATTWTFSGASSVLTIPVMTITATGVALVFNGTTGCTLTDNNGTTFKSLTLGTNAILENNGALYSTFSSSTSPLTFTSGGTLTTTRHIYLVLTTTGNIINIIAGTPAWIQNSASLCYFLCGNNSVEITVPALAATGSAGFYFGNQSYTSTKILLGGNFSCNSLRVVLNGVTATTQFNTQNYSLTCLNLLFGSQNATSSSVRDIYLGSSIINISTAYDGTTYNVGGVNIYMQTSTWTCGGSFTQGSTHVVIPGTSSVTITNTGTFTSANKTFYTIIVNASGKTITLADDLFTNTFTLFAGSLAKAGFYVFQLASSNVWAAAGSGNWNTAANWSLGHVPTSGEDVIFNGSTSNQNATWDISPSVNAIGFMSNYSGTVTMTGQTTTVVADFSDYGTGAKNYGNTLTVTGDGGIFIASTVGAITSTSLSIVCQGTGSIAINKGANFSFVNLDLAYSGKTTTNNSVAALHLVDGVFHLHGGIYANGTNYVYLDATSQTAPLVMDAGSTTSGNSYMVVNVKAAITVNIPQIFSFYFLALSSTNTSGTAIININGAVAVSYISLYADGAGGTLTVNTNNNSISANGGYFYPGSNNATAVFNLNCGSSTITVAGAVNFGQYSAGVSNIDLSTSIWFVSSHWTFIANNTITPGTSQVTFTSALASIVTSAGKSFYDVVVNNASKAFSFADNVSLHNLTTTAMTSYTNTGATVTSSGNVTFNGTGTLNLGTGITLNGTSNALSINSTVGTITAGSCIITMNTTTLGTFTISKTLTITQLILGANASVTIDGVGNNLTITGPNGIQFTNGGTLTVNKVVFVYITSSGNAVNIVAGSPVLNGSSSIRIRPTGNNVSLAIPALTCIGSFALYLIQDLNYTGTIFNINGPLNMTGALILGTSAGAGTLNDLTINTNNNTITCGALSFGSPSGGGSISIILNCGSSIFNVTSFSGSPDNPNAYLNLQNSQWLCSGSWAFGSNHTITHQWDSITLTGTGTLTNAGKYINYLIINAPGKTVTLADNLQCRAYQNSAGTLNNNGKQVKVLGDYVACQIETSGVS